MYTQPQLNYSFSDLEPHIDARTMEIHYGKHHKTYIDKYNAAVEKYPELAAKSLEEVIANLSAVPEDIRGAVKNNGCQSWNHSFFWTMMKKNGGGEPTGALADAITASFGDFEAFKKKFSDSALAVFGSGWTWLVSNNGKLEILNTSNEATPLTQGMKPIMVLDVWEHAYYLNYQNRRADYIAAWWNVLDWESIARNV